MNGINTILIILIYTSFIDLAQKVYVTLGTTSNMYFKTDDCKKLKSAGCSSFSISIQQAKSIGTKSCDICYSANDIQYYQPTISSSKNTSKKQIIRLRSLLQVLKFLQLLQEHNYK